ncbi:methyltransferase domain-containing protein [Sphingomonas sp. NSE70-1]|uniref:Methyltransferase domain-containing protein n=1 Tax=Sphingomonas caseinilyticus TaxID=2908205 RepID=A0ABT0RY41_9SPHN|nr:methyltransferase domain-containing protein [Sphingomonas caseinilyticus]MCL6699794.1 methyltransferase domain-containing protein [Sphingomonas caseinilyticus]
MFACAAIAGCRAEPQPNEFPKTGRAVAPIVNDSFSTEDVRDRTGEAEEVMRLAEIAPGMSVADVGAGEGYYTVRLSPIVGRRGRVLAQDIVRATRDRLAQRVQRERLDNVAVSLGVPANPMLPAHSFDRIFLVHMYHEVTQPYEFLWNLRESLKPDGLVIVVDSNRPVKRHGMPPRQLMCEFAALGLAPTKAVRLAGSDAYFTAFRLASPRPRPGDIKPCPDEKHSDSQQQLEPAAQGS